MEQFPFIFSNEKKYRIRRHVCFWLFWYVFFGVLYAYTANKSFLPEFRRLPASFVDSFFFLSTHIFLSYTLMYVVLPRLLLRGKYLYTAMAVLVCFLVTAVLSAVIGNYILPHIRYWLLGISLVHPTNQSFLLALLAGLRGAITVGGIAVAIKLMKYWHQKEQNNLLLQKENSETKLELLKAQVHPHFLFNTLNNLYSLTLIQSSNAPVVVSNLSDLLRYMLYECNEKVVPLSKEIEVLRKYAELEKLRYGNRVDVSFVCNGNIQAFSVAPLIFLPFLENSFKHGINHQLDQCWVNLDIHTDEDSVYFHLSNSIAADNSSSGVGGIGIQNVLKRLELLYPGKYHLTMTEQDEMFVVNLSIRLNSEIAAAKDIVYSSYEPRPVTA